MNNHLIDISNAALSWYFINSKIVVEKTDYTNIHFLDKIYSCLLWEEKISSNKKERHLMLLNKNHFKNYNRIKLYNWFEDWNNNAFVHFQAILKNNVNYKLDDIIYLFWMKEISMKLTWSLFIKYWPDFLYDDEGVIIINNNSKDILLFSNGESWILRLHTNTADISTEH